MKRRVNWEEKADLEAFEKPEQLGGPPKIRREDLSLDGMTPEKEVASGSKKAKSSGAATSIPGLGWFSVSFQKHEKMFMGFWCSSSWLFPF